jgi:secondary thiamine-phosphate synthase enzyme
MRSVSKNSRFQFPAGAFNISARAEAHATEITESRKDSSMKVLEVGTKKKREIVDVTERCRKELPSVQASDGVCHLFVLHTTAALTVADLDPGTDLDLLDAFEALVPKLKYRHPHDPAHVPDHILSALIGTSVSVPVQGGDFLLGVWQRIILVEFDGPRRRQIALSFTGESGG